MNLSAAQFIYTNVEKKLSPTHRDGFQIWLRTPDVLDAADETELQARLGDFEDRKAGSDELVTRHLFFCLPSGRAVIARGVPLIETDKFSRGGRFYAHAFVLEAADFRRLDNDPFAVFDQVTFQSSLEEGLRIGDPKSGTIPPAPLRDRLAEPVKPELSVEKLTPLLPMLLRACGQDRPVIIGVPGTPAQTLQLVRELFAWLPPSLRRRCSFDTLSTGRSLSQVPFAVVGLPPAGPPRRVLNLLVFDPVRQAFHQPPPGAPADTFENWLKAQLNRSSMPPPISKSEAVFQLGRCLDRGRVDHGDLADVDAATFEEIGYGDQGVPKLERLLLARLETDVGTALSPLLVAHAHTRLRSAGLNGLRGLADPYESELLVRWLLAVYEQRRANEIDRELEVPALKEALERTKNVRGAAGAERKKLLLIYCRWGRIWSALARWVRDSKSVPAEVYEWFVPWALSTISIQVSMGAGFSDGRTWIGPLVEILGGDESDGEKLVASLLGIDPSGESEEKLPPDRWAWALETLKHRIAPSADGGSAE